MDSNSTKILNICDVRLGSKVLKNWKRSKAKLINDKLLMSSEITTIIAIANAGLGNGVKREEIKDIVTKLIGENYTVVQPVTKSYAMVKLKNEEDAKVIFKEMMGFCLKSPDNLATPSATFYTHFLAEIPNLTNRKIENVELTGLKILENFISENEEIYLLSCLNKKSTEQNFEDVKNELKNRQVWHYGYEFIYGTNDFDINKPIAIPIEIQEIINKMIEQNVIENVPNQITINKYLPGQGIPYHIDNPNAFTEDLLSLSLGSKTVMDFKHPNGVVVHKVLNPRSLLIMQKDARYLWMHGICPRKVDLINDDSSNETTSVNRGERISVTFRVINKDYTRDIKV